eukprot:7944-Pelagococcus_subviridis.AAC.3
MREKWICAFPARFVRPELVNSSNSSRFAPLQRTPLGGISNRGRGDSWDNSPNNYEPKTRRRLREVGAREAARAERTARARRPHASGRTRDEKRAPQ